MWFKVDPTNPLDMSVLVCFNVYYPNTHTQTWPRTPPWGSNHVRTTTAQPYLRHYMYPWDCVWRWVPSPPKAEWVASMRARHYGLERSASMRASTVPLSCGHVCRLVIC